MKKIVDILFSIRTTIVLLSIFGIAIGYATFVENGEGTPAAKALVYNANWFVVLLLLSAANLVGVIVNTKLVQRKKWSVLLFHCAFICILIGSAITRYFGYEGIMHIRQGETSNVISTEKTALKIEAEYKGQKVEKSVEVAFSETGNNTFSESVVVGGKTITVENELFVPNAQEMVESSTEGEPAIQVFIMSGSSQSMDMTLFGDETGNAGDLIFGFERPGSKNDINFKVVNDSLYFASSVGVSHTGTLASGMIDKANAIPVEAGKYIAGEQNTVYRAKHLVFMIKGFIPRAVKTLTQMSPEESNGMDGAMMGNDALVMRVTDGNSDKKINVLKSSDEMPLSSSCQLNDVKVTVSYGKMMMPLPFSITLRKFELDRYQGSMSPSSYASEITLKDTEMKVERPYRIFMNNILNYRGYRFFQSSYDPDEMGTILSVNHDYWGTFVTYIGYLLMLIGMVLTLFDKKSRFQTLMKLASQMQEKRKSAITIFALMLSSTLLFAQNGIEKSDHLASFSRLLIQDGVQGRIEPVSTFASDILRKIYKKNEFNGKSPEEVFLGMIATPDVWKNEYIIKVYHTQLAKELGAINGYVSYNQMFDKQTGRYKLMGIVDKAYIKDQSKRNTYEKEVVNVDERFNILSQIFDGTMLNIFPVKDAQDGKWTSARTAVMAAPMSMSSGAVCPHLANQGTTSGDAPMGGAMGETQESGLTGEMPPMDDEESDAPAETAETPNPHAEMGAMPMPDHSMGDCTRDHGSTMGAINPHGAMGAISSSPDSPEGLQFAYFEAVAKAQKTGNWNDANSALDKIKSYQTANGTQIPSDTNISLEIAYNQWNLFGNLATIYFIIGFILLAFHLVNIFKYSPKLDRLLGYSIYPLGALFALFTGGMALRWIISGHAPWSNGYESMVFVGWAASLAGLLFARKSPLAFSITAILSAIALMVAGMSWMNPEITNLVPVLKSYWLVVHVAIITSSYGFFAMGMLLGLLNLLLMIVRGLRKRTDITDSIKKIGYIIEMSLIVGLFLLTVGNFLGGVWANESWGRYWGWDAKETWALVSILVYAVILHVRMIPRGNNPFILSTLAVVGFASVIMTFLGVNYYLSGMHSYGKGTPPPLPDALFLVIVVVVAIIVTAFVLEKKAGSFEKTKPE